MDKIALKRSWVARALLAAAWILGMAFIPAQTAHAAACVVTNANDSGTGSLREKIGDSSCTTITFANDTTINLGSRLYVNTSKTIDGSGHKVVLNGQDTTQIFYFTSNSTSTLNSLTITHGYLPLARHMALDLQFWRLDRAQQHLHL